MAYIEFAKKRFMNHMVYRFDYLMGVLDTCLQLLIFWSIYKALYGTKEEIMGVTFTMVITHFVITQGLSAVFSVDDSFVSGKIRDGSIANELLKPVNFRGRILAETLGDIFFSLLFHFIPIVVLATITFDIAFPADVKSIFLFFISVILGFFIFFNLGYVIQMASFWIINVWSISTIIHVAINILSGALFPLWFMPERFRFLLMYTPFSSIYFTPVQIYLERVRGFELFTVFFRQLLWIAILHIVGEFMWKAGKRKIVVQGG